MNNGLNGFGKENEVDVGALTRRILHTFVNKMQYRSNGGVCGMVRETGQKMNEFI